MAADVEAVIAALRVALDEAQKSNEADWKVEAANRWVGQLPGAWSGRWRKLVLEGDCVGNVDRGEFVGHVRAALAFLEASRTQIAPSRQWWPMRRRGGATQTAGKSDPQASTSARPVNLLRIRKPMPGLH